GPALGGMLIALVEPAGAYLLTAACATATVLLIGTTRPSIQERPGVGRSLASLLAGARFVWHTKPILATITLDLFAVLFGAAPARGGDLAVDRLVHRAGRLRLGRAGPRVRADRLGGRRRHRHEPGRAGRDVAMARGAAPRPAAPGRPA